MTDIPQIVTWPVRSAFDHGDHGSKAATVAAATDQPDAEAAAEREAIRWVERLPDAEASEIVQEAIADWRSIVDGGGDETPADAGTGDPGWHWEQDTVDPDEVPPCPACSSLIAWQAMTGVWHCLLCDPPRTADRLRRQARQVEQRGKVQRNERNETQKGLSL